MKSPRSSSLTHSKMGFQSPKSFQKMGEKKGKGKEILVTKFVVENKKEKVKKR